MKYIAITIGPIVSTLLSAQKTGELWASSYIFSYIMKNFVTEIKHQNIGEVILPIASESEEKKNGAGLYPDRIYMTAPNNQADLEKVKAVIDKVLIDFSDKVSVDLLLINDNPFSDADVNKYLKSFFKIYTIMVDIPEGENIVTELSTYCDSAELQNRIYPVEDIHCKLYHGKMINPLQFFLKNINNSFLLKEAFDGKKTHFDSLLEISTREFKNSEPQKYQHIITESKNIDEDEDYIIDNLKREFPAKFMARHKYFALVHADGDNIGKIINAVGNNEDNLKTFSKKLYAFANDATNIIINKFDGVPIYMGGDDMLFLAPITNNKDKDCYTIFNLIESLDECFDNEIIKYASNDLKLTDEIPSMSYGVAINYYKEPLYEVRNNSYGLLEHVKQKIKGKNCVNVKFQKHSGQQIEFAVSKANNEYTIFTNLIANGGNIDENFINSFTHKLEINAPFLKQVANNKERIKAFFEHNFNENYKANHKFFEAIQEYILQMHEIRNAFNDNEIKQLYGALRFLHFINSNDKE